MAGLVVLSLLLLFAVPARADHLYATSKLPPGFPTPLYRINMNANCGGSVNYPANAGFFVAHGWFDPSWNDATATEKKQFVSPKTTYVLWIDGVKQKSAQHSWLSNNPDGSQAMFKIFVIEDHDGMTGSNHTFVGKHFNYGVLAILCTVTVSFV